MKVSEYETEDGWQRTEVAIIDPEDGGKVLSSTVEREYYRSERQYRRAVDGAIKDDLHWVGKTVLKEVTSS